MWYKYSVGIKFSYYKVFLFSIAVATILQGCSSCDDGSGIAKVCHLNRPCGITNNGTVVLADNFKDHDIYKTGECKFGTVECDADGNEVCVGFITPSEEICDELDNNCDGTTDEAVEVLSDYDVDDAVGGIVEWNIKADA